MVCVLVTWVTVLSESPMADVPSLGDFHVHILVNEGLHESLSKVYLPGAEAF